MIDTIKNNPAAFIAALRALTIGAFGLAVAFGLKVTPDQQSALLEFTGAVVTIALLFSVATVSNTVPKTPTASAPPQAIQTPVPPAPPA